MNTTDKPPPFPVIESRDGGELFFWDEPKTISYVWPDTDTMLRDMGSGAIADGIKEGE